MVAMKRTSHINIVLEKSNSYPTPYHWFIDRSTTKGRMYFGYLDWCAKQASGKVLDVGCGDGRFVAMLEGDVRGVDTDSRGVAFAKLIHSEGTYEVVDGKVLPYPDKTFDTIFLIETLEHIHPDDIPATITEISRVLKDDGQLVITVPSTRMVNKPGSKHYQHFTPASLQNAVATEFVADIFGQNRAGFHLLKVFYKLLDNPLWLIRPVAAWYNLRIWPRFFNTCSAEKGNRLMALCKKNG